MSIDNQNQVVETINTTTNSNTITSLELVKQINIFRSQAEDKSELRHDNLLTIIRDEFEEEIVALKIKECDYQGENNRRYPMFNLTFDQAKQVLARESKIVRRALFEYIKQLEERVSKQKMPSTYLEALKALVEVEEEKERLLLENSAMKPKVIYFDGLVERNLLVNFRTLAKELQIKESLLIANLIKDGFCYRTATKTDKNGKVKIGKLKAIAKYINKDDEKSLYFEEKEWDSGKTAGTQTLITQRGRQAFLLIYKQQS
jgi:phage antirepressor YoqD-like protein